jgi:hypothetical protein
LQNIEGRPLYLLEGEPLTHGDAVELLLENENWLRGVWEWSGQEIRWPGLRFKLGGDAPLYAHDTARTAIVALPPNAILRRVRP